LILLLVALISAQDSSPQLYYSVTVPTDRSAYLVELQINNPPNPSRLVIPNWAPGAYRLMDSWQNIRDVVAVSAAGDPLPVHPDSPISWVIDPKGASRITIRYTAGLREAD
jgi:predicted metalloprotease with PDZ domain